MSPTSPPDDFSHRPGVAFDLVQPALPQLRENKGTIVAVTTVATRR
ncbi:hypothetical protein [Streptomyces acidiscabies]